MLEIEKVNNGDNPLKIESERTEVLADPESFEQSYERIKQQIIEEEERELRYTEYSLAESDGDQWYSHKIYKQRVEFIDSIRNKPKEQREREIKAKVIHEIFSRTQSQEKIVENQTPTNSSPIVVFSAEANLH
jgi:hypothetical protein